MTNTKPPWDKEFESLFIVNLKTDCDHGVTPEGTFTGVKCNCYEIDTDDIKTFIKKVEQEAYERGYEARQKEIRLASKKSRAKNKGKYKERRREENRRYRAKHKERLNYERRRIKF